MSGPTPEEVEALYRRLDEEAERSGYHLNPDRGFTRGLVEGLLVNQERFGYMLCPCRLGDGDRLEDVDIVCPCDYRDPDVEQYGACYCALYVSQEIKEGRAKARRIPERRPARELRGQHRSGKAPRPAPQPPRPAPPAGRSGAAGSAATCAPASPPRKPAPSATRRRIASSPSRSSFQAWSFHRETRPKAATVAEAEGTTSAKS